MRKVTSTFRMPLDLKTKISKKGQNLSACIGEAIENFLDNTNDIDEALLSEKKFKRCVPTAFSISPGLKQRARQFALNSDISFADLISLALYKHLQNASISLNSAKDEYGFTKGSKSSLMYALLSVNKYTKKEILKIMDEKYPAANNKSSLSTFISDIQKPIGVYSTSRGVKVVTSDNGILSIKR